MKLIFLGAPGAGKGSQATLIKEAYSIPHISTGDIFRANIKGGTELGKLAKSYIDRGELVPDSVVIDIVKDRLLQEDCKNGFILDGFPRTVVQADALEEVAAIDAVINLVVENAVIIRRIAGRRMCSCGESYNTATLTGPEICLKCGGTLYQRADDKEETVKNRLAVYDKETAPLIEYYRAKGLLIDIDCNNRTISETDKDIRKLLESI
ncbi:MAG: adenylate kinase [Clostridia bacterium]|nr:adenylate kinase [Clostridia bacterium]